MNPTQAAPVGRRAFAPAQPQRDAVAGPGDRIVVIGNGPGAGKTVFAQRLAARLGLPHIELDALHWILPNWAPPPVDEFRARVDGATSTPAWVAEGGYSKTRDLVWGRADTIVWLDFPLRVHFWRLAWRSLRLVRRRELLWGTNRQTPRAALRLVTWLLRTFARRRRQYAQMMRSPPYDTKRWIRFARPGDAEAWLAEVTPAGAQR
ncbi:MAG: hypothetical protein FJ029_09240 [Actinobacteria bacterium]|nr:hypothetical protein [Actinomycetota bacterium]